MKEKRQKEKYRDYQLELWARALASQKARMKEWERKS